MTKQATARQIETAQSEIRRAIGDVISAWRTQDPCPSYEEEQEWVERNPSPRRLHSQKESELRSALEREAHELTLKLKMGEVDGDGAYTELKVLLDALQEKRLAYLNLK